jgi:hypothetical protein
MKKDNIVAHMEAISLVKGFVGAQYYFQEV